MLFDRPLWSVPQDYCEPEHKTIGAEDADSATSAHGMRELYCRLESPSGSGAHPELNEDQLFGSTNVDFRSVLKSNCAVLIGVPSTSICRRSRVPTPRLSARRSVLSQFSKGMVPRSAIGSNPMTAVPAASVVTQFVPAIKTPG